MKTQGMRRLLLVAIVPILTGCHRAESTIKPDEEILFFPTSASFNEERQLWNAPVQGWIYEPERDSKQRTLLLDGLAALLELKSGAAEEMLFRERAAMFLVDNKGGKRIAVRSGAVSERLGPSAPNGHFSGILRLTRGDVESLPGKPWAAFGAVMPEGDSRRFQGRVQLLAPEGISVISDIDDTIKISEVLDKRTFLENTFLKPFLPVPGMAETYRRWRDQGAAFHYVSSSPWQLYPTLQKFIDSGGFPAGSVSLRLFRVKDSSFFNFLKESEQYKHETIRAILARYPGRRFVLVGDAGEKDPEIYGAIAREFPRQVARVYIRDLGRVPDEGPRMRAAFRGVAPSRWALFRDPGDLAKQL